MKTIKHLESKGKNKRINIYLLKDKKDVHSLVIQTKTLIDFKTRKISKTDNHYSIETAFILKELLSFLLDNSEVANKILLKEINKINQFQTITNINI